MDTGQIRRRIFFVRLKQFVTTFFVILSSTLMIQNVWYPAAFSYFKKSYRAGIGSIIFLIGFVAARALFDTYGREVRNLKRQLSQGAFSEPGDTEPRETGLENDGPAD
jgi:hypothetical protein